MTPPFLIALLQRKKLSDKAEGNLKPEERLTVAVANMLRQASLQGRLRAVWFHVPNEHQGKGRVHMLRIAVKIAMGVIPGVSDFAVMWASGAGVIEMKVGTGLSDHQRNFSNWCGHQGVRFVLCRSVEKVEGTLEEWGVLNRAGK